MIVLDTNVVSEVMRPSPSTRVLGWLRGQTEDDLYTTAITLAEIKYGIARLPEGRRKQLLGETADDVFAEFARQVLPFDHRAASHYGTIVAEREEAGRPIDGFDAQIAAGCREDPAG